MLVLLVYGADLLNPPLEIGIDLQAVAQVGVEHGNDCHAAPGGSPKVKHLLC